jgi:Phage capsid family
MDDVKVEIEGLRARAEKWTKEGLEEVAGLKAEVRAMEQRQAALPSGGTYSGSYGNTIGDQVVKQFAAHSGNFSRSKSLRLEGLALPAVNALATDPITTGSGRTILSDGIGVPGAFSHGVQAAFPQRVVEGITAAEYSRYSGVEGAAAVQVAEGARKAQLRPAFTVIQQTGLTVAGFTKISRQAMGDSVELKNAIDVVLQRAVGVALDAALNVGVLTPLFEGMLALSTPATSLTYTAMVDAVSEAVAQMQLDGFQPTSVVLGPMDWLSISVQRATDGQYLAGPYMGSVPQALRGLAVILSPSIPAGKAMVIDRSHLQLLVVDGFSVELGFENDDFTRNLVTVLGETRVIPQFRAIGAARLVTAKAA